AVILEAGRVYRTAQALALGDAQEPGKSEDDDDANNQGRDHRDENFRRVQTRAAAARTVGPPQGKIFMVPLIRPATTVSTTGLMPMRKYSGNIAEVVIINVVEPSPSRETTPASSAVPSTILAGSLPNARVIIRMRGSNSPTSIMMPKYIMANINNAAVGAISFMASMTMSPMPRPAPAIRPKMVGTKINAIIGVERPSMISVMKVTIMAKPNPTRIPSDSVCV